ncbi:MAG: hypothetical protein R2838_02970, partial [Caldilineaceae bacterium]
CVSWQERGEYGKRRVSVRLVVLHMALTAWEAANPWLRAMQDTAIIPSNQFLGGFCARLTRESHCSISTKFLCFSTKTVSAIITIA